MKILQIIDSLEAGGAERMAVNYANALSKKVKFSGIVVTRKEGILKDDIHVTVDYLFLNKKNSIDIKATNKLLNYCKLHKIDVLQAHTSSYFIAVLIKIFYPRITIIWHDHYGLSEFLDARKSTFLALSSFLFSGIISVNSQLKKWSQEKLFCKKNIYLPNFTSTIENEKKETVLEGTEGKRILCLANLRPQKNHFFLLEIAKSITKKYPDWSFHLVGKDFKDDYSNTIKMQIVDNHLEKSVFIYDSRKDIQNIINQSEIAILTSQSEGLPISLLEYGLNSKAVISTAVGEIPKIIKNNSNGFIVDKENLVNFINNLELLINDKELRQKLGESLFETIKKNNSEQAIISSYIKWLSSI